MKYDVQIFVYFVLQHLPFIGTVTIDFNSIGYIGKSIVLQCQDTPPIAASSADWYLGGSLMDISSSRYTQTTTPTGFNLTISSLVTADGGDFHCGIDFGISTTKCLTIYYNTKNVDITKLYPKGIEITFIAFPDPDYKVTVKQDGVQLDANWNVYKSTQASGAIKYLLQNSTAFTNQNKIYTVHVNITSPVSLDVEKDITWVSNLKTQSKDGLVCYQCADSTADLVEADCQNYTRLKEDRFNAEQNGRMGSYFKSCTGNNETFCVIEVIRSGGDTFSYIRDCSDGSALENLAADNQTRCSYRKDGYLACVTLCNTYLCNGPTGGVTYHFINQLVMLLALTLCLLFKRFN